MSLRPDINIVKRIYPESEFKIKTSIIQNYSIENEWRLVATIKNANVTLEKRKRIFFLKNEEKLKEIERRSGYPIKSLKKMPFNELNGIEDRLSEYLWVPKITVKNDRLFHDCAKIMSK